jgi:electron transfer flavoprotein beta subunit
MKILVAIKQVAALDEDFEFRADGRDVDADFIIHDLNEWDDFSLEEAVKIKEAAGTPVEVVALSVGPESVDEVLRKCLAKGADRAVRVWDEAIEGSDSMAIARVLAAAARREAPDLLFAGVQSSDQSFASTGIAAAAFLEWPHAAVVAELRYSPGAKTATCRRELEGGLLQELEIQCPAVLTIQLGINTPRYASLRSIKQAAAKPIEVLSPGDLGLGAADLGEAGSASRVRRMYVPDKGRARLIEGDAAAQAAELAAIIHEFKAGAAAAGGAAAGAAGGAAPSGGTPAPAPTRMAGPAAGQPA